MVNMVDNCLLNMRMFYDMMEDYIREEYNLWTAWRNREERINKRERYMEQDKFNTQE